MRSFISKQLRLQVRSLQFLVYHPCSSQPLNQTIEFEGEKQEVRSQASQEHLEMLANLNEYELGLKFMDQGKYRLAFEFFKRVRDYQQTNSIQQGDGWLHVQQKMALTLYHLRRYEDCEKALETIIENNQRFSANDAVLYDSYNNLFIHCLNTNLNKAILLGKALLCQEEKQKIPLSYQKQFIFNLGTAYLLQENYPDAKERLRECLLSEPNALLKGQALNNLAVASWLHKIPDLTQQLIEDTDGKEIRQDHQYSDHQIDQDFKYVIPLLKRSIKFIESVDGDKDNQQQGMMDLLLDENVLIPKEYKVNDNVSMPLSQKQSGIPILNLSEFIFNTDSTKRIEAEFWFKQTMKFYEKNDPNNMDRTLVLLAWLCSSSADYDRADILFKRTLEMLDQNDSYNKVLCLQLYGTMLKQNPQTSKEGQDLINQAYLVAEKLPSWSNRLVHVLVPEMDL